ncbi:SseB family protein [Streptomyces hoynatensis]|uniref:SseB family protein n=2 Tax=Streptomyces hoynatensis TaxID=1141874 RepID=A0A3A9Z2L1_9ACTN|nr:SAV_915 family protein [Streptomyces hoynatensis]RKN41656.1 SseB family protein [Streptomyces hoynatensis]
MSADGPADTLPAGRYHVPVRPGPAHTTRVRLFRTPHGEATVVAFTSERRLVAALGPGQPWATLCDRALLALTEPLGVTALVVDPQPAALAGRPARRLRAAAA